MIKIFKPRDSQQIGYGNVRIEITECYVAYLEFFICLADKPMELVLIIAHSRVTIGSSYPDLQLQRHADRLADEPYSFPREWFQRRGKCEIVRVVEASIPTLQNALQTMFPEASWVWLNG